MHKKLALIVAGIVFSIVTLVHLSRLVLGFQLIIAGYSIPLKANIIGLIISLLLALWMFIAAKH